MYLIYKGQVYVLCKEVVEERGEKSIHPEKLIYPTHYLIIVIKMAEIPLAPVTRLIRNAGVERISKDATVEFAKLLEAECAKIAKKAVNLAKHAGRKTVKVEDIRQAVESTGHKKSFKSQQNLGPHDLGIKIVMKKK